MAGNKVTVKEGTVEPSWDFGRPYIFGSPGSSRVGVLVRMNLAHSLASGLGLCCLGTQRHQMASEQPKMPNLT